MNKNKKSKKGKTGIRQKMLLVSVFPTIFLGAIIFVFGIVLIYGFATESVESELQSTAYMLKGCFDMTVRGDYSYENDILKKGDLNITDSSMLYEIKDTANVDTTIFWDNVRILTTIENNQGISAAGTKASDRVSEIVLNGGNDYYIRNVIITGKHYIGFYTPLKNANGEVVGMVFAGKTMGDVYKSVTQIILWFLLFSFIAACIAIFMSRGFSEKLVLDIDVIKHYLHMLTIGNFSVSMNERIVQRQDEIGEIGTYAIKMGNALESFIELDNLTSLYNRRSCHNRIKRLVDAKKRFTFVMGDIDFFKKINDQYGHECGDRVLIFISKMIKDSVGKDGFACRWGGEEFLLVYELDFETAKQRVELLLDQIRDFRFEYNTQDIRVTMTFGMKEMAEIGVSYEKIINEADNKLYEGKKQGRNRIIS